ncbi:serine/threonine protein kinase [Nitzschia inconspicua]|uniref:Serine/threonine protein kinase n=1 Tax=Nitzschia inconspicua TaxID=303405 RepID=A0A9K3KBG7_9STRA|nr:serine/threonine protein kinase [Nitzschia inconspicua]
MGSCQSTEDTTFVPPSSGNTTVGTTSVVTDAYSGTANLVPERSPKNNHETKNKPPLHPLAASVSTTDQNSHLNYSDDDGSSDAAANGNRSGRASGYATPSAGTSQHDDNITETSSIGSGGNRSNGRRNPKSLVHSSSVIGLDSMIESRRENEGGITANVVHMEVPFGKPIEEVYDGVHTGPVLGSGISGLVRLVTHKATGVKYAVKCLDLGLVDTKEGLAQLREEIFIMCQLDHPNIVRLEEVYESHSEIYLVQELCLGGELFDRLDEQPDYHYTEAECARLIKQMLCAVRYLHSKGIIHRDLKLENFLFSSTAKDSELKMIDFGLSKHFRYGEVQYEAVGTPYTVAPEVIRGCYDERCDIWAVGVIAFLLLSGDPPFGGCGGPEPLMTVRSNILRGHFAFEPADIWAVVSDKAREFISALLVTDPQKRPTAREAQLHDWLVEWADRERSDNDNVLNPNVVKALVNFKEFSDMRKLLCEVLSFTLLPEQIKDLRKEFETLDTDGSGEISLSALKQVLVTNAGAGSLGALTEEEVEDIFNAMRVKKSETRIHWHEFIAAGLSQCEVDDRNLRLAFDRLDNDHKGYVTLDDIMDLVGSDSTNEESLRKMWGDSMKACKCSTARITYDDFLLIMKGQTREDVAAHSAQVPLPRVESTPQLGTGALHVVKEEEPEFIAAGPNAYEKVTPSGLRPITSLMPLTPKAQHQELDTPLSMDEDDAMQVTVPSPNYPMVPGLTPPVTPLRGASDYLSPRSSPRLLSITRSTEDLMSLNNSNPDMPRLLPIPGIPQPGLCSRQKSRSLDETQLQSALEVVMPAAAFPSDVRRAVALPETDSRSCAIINDPSVSALQVNRKLYRAHRTMRLSVMEACKRFEEQQAKRARDVLLAQEEENNKARKGHAGLVMRRVENKTVSSEAIKQFLEQSHKEQQDLMEKANKRGGRGRRIRKKTISDMGAMMGSLSNEEMTRISMQAANPQSEQEKVPPSIPPVIETKPLEENGAGIRGATIPGEFRKVNDPFGAHGKYSALL